MHFENERMQHLKIFAAGDEFVYRGEQFWDLDTFFTSMQFSPASDKLCDQPVGYLKS